MNQKPSKPAKQTIQNPDFSDFLAKLLQAIIAKEQIVVEFKLTLEKISGDDEDNSDRTGTTQSVENHLVKMKVDDVFYDGTYLIGFVGREIGTRKKLFLPCLTNFYTYIPGYGVNVVSEMVSVETKTEVYTKNASGLGLDARLFRTDKKWYSNDLYQIEVDDKKKVLLETETSRYVRLRS